MRYLLGLAFCLAGVVASAQISEIGSPPGVSGAHSELFEGPESEDIARRTARLTAGLEAESSEVAPRNFIDDRIFGKMQRDSVPHAPLANDREFLRRARLDLTGRIPTAEEIRSFLQDSNESKREALIAELVGGDEWVDKWSYFLMDSLRANGKMQGYQLFHYMLNQSLAADRPYSDLVASMIASSAKSNKVIAAANPIVREHVEGKPGQVLHGDDLSKVHQLDTHDELTIQFGKLFLGMNLSCISCHDGAGHLEKVNVYLSRQSRADFFQQAAFLGNTRYIPHVEGTEAKMGHFIVDDLAPGYDTEGASMLRMARLGGPETPKFILSDEPASPDADPRDELARMLTSERQFARATVNLFWGKLMGFGFVEPYDGFDLARLTPENLPEGWDVQPTHPELLEELAVKFEQSGYSLQWLFRTICESSAYQLSARFPGEWKDTYTDYYARKYVRMLTAEELHDAIVTATGKAGDLKDGDREVSLAMQVSVPRPKGETKSFLQAFGQSNRGTVARPPTASPMQPIMLMRSSVVTDRVTASEGSRLAALLDGNDSDSPVVEELFLSTIARDPTPAEKDLALTVLGEDRQQGAENLQWALLNMAEFLYNF